MAYHINMRRGLRENKGSKTHIGAGSPKNQILSPVDGRIMSRDTWEYCNHIPADGRIRCGLSYHREIKSLHLITPSSYPIISCGGSNHVKIRLSNQITGRRSGRRLSGLDNSKVREPGILPSPCPDVILLGKMPGYDGLDVGQKKSPAFRRGCGFFSWRRIS